MNCQIGNITVEGDKNGKLASIISSKQVVGNSGRIVTERLASDIKSNPQEIVEFANRDKNLSISSIGELLDVNANTLKSIFRRYYFNKYRNIHNTAANRTGNDLKGFNSQEALNTAIEYVAHRFVARKLDNNAKTKQEQINIINDIRREIKEEFDTMFDNKLKLIKAEYSSDNKQLPQIVKTYYEQIEKLNSLVDEMKDKEGDELKNLEEQYDSLELENNSKVFEIINEFGTIIEQNLTALYQQSETNPYEFFDAVARTSIVTKSSRILSDVVSEDIYDDNNIDADDSNDSTNNEHDSDETAFWNKGSVTNNYTKLIDNEFRNYISTHLVKLATPYQYGSQNQNYVRNELLGTIEYYDGDELLNNLLKQAENTSNIKDIDSLVAHLEKLSTTQAYFYGIGALVDRMKKDIEFKYFVYRNLSHFKVEKFIVTSDKDRYNISVSNSSAFVESTEYNKFFNSYRYNFRNIVPDDSRVVGISFKEPNFAEDKVTLKDKITKLFNVIAPAYPLTALYSYIDNETPYNLVRLNHNINILYDETLKLKSSENKSIDEITNNSKLLNATIDIIKAVTPYSVIPIELNTVNAENHQSSNLLANSHLGNLYKAIKSENYEGLLALGKEFDGCSQIAYNPLFYGIKNENGAYIVKGIFNKVDGQLTINEDVVKQLQIYLFDGIKGFDGSSTLYDGATKQDYFLTNLLVYLQGIKSRANETKGIKFFLNTPSDAPKNFVMSIPSVFTTVPTWINSDNYINELNRIEKVLNDNFKVDNRNDYDDLLNIKKGTYEQSAINERNNTDITKGSKTTKNRIENLNIIYNTITNPNRIKIDNSYFTYNFGDKGKYVPLLYFVGDTSYHFVFKVENNTLGSLISVKQYNPKTGLNDKLEGLKSELETSIKEELFNKGISSVIINRNSGIFKAYKQLLYNEINNFAEQLKNVLELDSIVDGKELYRVRKDTDGLHPKVHYNKKDNLLEVVKNSNGDEQYRLSGNFFKFTTLFKIGDFDINEELVNALSLYGGENSNAVIVHSQSENKTYFNKNNTSPLDITVDSSTGSLKVTLKQNKELNDIIDNLVYSWLQEFNNYISNKLSDYTNVLDAYNEKQKLNYQNVVEFVIASSYARLVTEPLLTGDSKYYAKNNNDVKTFFKRAKETQAGGSVYYGGNLFTEHGTEIKNLQLYNGGNELLYTSYVNGKDYPIYARNGYRGVTIENTRKISSQVGILTEQLDKDLQHKVDTGKLSENSKRKIEEYLLKAYSSEATIANDAQSYITFEEFVRRSFQNGTYGKYKDLIEQITRFRKGELSAEDIDLEQLGSIQVQKNFYFDIKRDSLVNTMYPRQIKNSEFVIIPEFVKGTSLELLYNIMIENGIDQINTTETSKAATRGVLTFWDNDGNVVDEKQLAEFKRLTSPVKGKYDGNIVEDYYYNNLFKQLDVPQHIKDETIKIPVQFTKKLLDNLDDSFNPFVEQFQRNYIANIRNSYMQMLYNMGWKVNENGEIVNRKDNSTDLDFREFYKLAKQEAERLGLDSNFAEYFIVDDGTGHPKMPNYLNINADKLESIFQSIVNNRVRKQELPGWHCTQVSSVGYEININGEKRKLKYRNIDKDGKSTKYVEILIPRWSSNIPKYKPSLRQENESVYDYHERITRERQEFDAKIIKKLEEKGLDLHVILRIPTEGKQSIAVAKVVGFVDDSMGSTIVVPDEWVTQTGSDFDVDSIYGFTSKFRYNENTEEFEKIEGNYGTKEKDLENRYISYINSLIKNGKNSAIIEDLSDYKSQLLNIKKDNDENVNTIYEQLHNLYDELHNSKQFKELNNKFWNIVDSLPESLKAKIKKNAAYYNSQKLSYLERDKRFVSTFERILSFKGYDNVKDKIQELLDIVNERLTINDVFININELNKAKNELIDKYHDTVLSYYEQLARKHNLISLDEFTQWNISEQQNRNVRDNEIVSSCISILTNNNSVEENLSRSNFDDIKQITAYIGHLLETKTSIQNEENLINSLKGWARTATNGYEVSSQGDKRFSALYATFKPGTIVFGHDVSGRTIESVYQHGVKQGDWNTDNNSKTGTPKDKTIITGNTEDASYEQGYLPLWQEWAKQNPELIQELKEKAFGKVLTDKFASTRVSQARALFNIINVKNNTNISNNSSISSQTSNITINAQSSGNTLTQIEQFKDAEAGRTLKARSVQRDTFLSLSNRLHLMIPKGIKIRYDLSLDIEEKNDDDKWEKVKYYGNDSIDKLQADVQLLYGANLPIDGNKITITHDKLGWNKNEKVVNNRNIVGRLITIYGSETTSHILDAIKEGTIINETLDTFPAFKTLLDLGTDYATAIAFLAQPAINILVEKYNENSSIYIETKGNAIKSALFEILTKSGVDNITPFTSKEKLYQAAKKHFGFNESTFEDFKDNIVLDQRDLFDNLKNNENYLHQFTILALYDKLNDIGQDIDKLIRISNPDKFGAKQTIQSTNKTLIDAINAADIEIYTDEGVQFVEALYPGLTTGVIDENKSKYGYLAAYLKYCTIPSVTYGQQLFTLSGKAIDTPWNKYRMLKLTAPTDLVEKHIYMYNNSGLIQKTEAAIGKGLSDDNVKKLKKYIVSSIFNSQGVDLLKPVTINDKGMIVPSTEELTESNYEAEKQRIFGVKAEGPIYFELKDFNNPTEEEFKQFESLTPAQKVDWMKRCFLDDAGIFNYLETSYHDKSYNNFDVIKNTIKLEFGHDVENLFKEFQFIAFNKHPFVKLTAIDLVKYAFIVEGFNFRRNSISKAIANSFLYSTGEEFGFSTISDKSLIDELNQEMFNFDTRNYSSDTFIDKFIKQNIDLVGTYKLYDSKRKGLNYLTEFKKRHVGDNDFLLTVGENDICDTIIKRIVSNEYRPIKYIHLISNKSDYGVFKVNPIYITNEKGHKQLFKLYLYPIGQLNENEFGDMSVVNSNNPKHDKYFYEEKLREIKAPFLAELENNDIEYVDSTLRENKVLNIESPNIEIKKVDDYYLQKCLNGEIKNDNLKGFTNLIINSIDDNTLFPVEGTISKKFTTTARNKDAIEFIGENNSIVQRLIINGTQYSLLISSSNKNSKGELPLVIERIYETNSDINDANNDNYERVQKQMATTGLIIGESTESVQDKLDDSYRIAAVLAKSLLKKEGKIDNPILNRFSHKVSTGELVMANNDSIIRNKKMILDTAANFYQQEAKLILNRLSKYEIDGKKFALNDPNLYNELIKHPEYYDDLVNLILYAKNFGRDIYEIFKMDITTEDTDVQNAINDIRKAIDSVRNSNYITGENGAIKHIFDIYFAKVYANNPLVRHELINLRTQFGDVNWFDLQFADVGHLNNKQIQTIVKSVYSILDKAKDIDAPNEVRKFLQEYDDLMKRGDIDMSKIIDKDGKYIQSYTEDYLKEKQRLNDNFVEAQVKYGKYSKEAIKAKLERDEWFAKNVEQLLVKDYYDKVNAAVREVFTKAPDYYIEYLRLQEEITRLTYDSRANTEEDRKMLVTLKSKLNNLVSVYKGNVSETELFDFSEIVEDEKAIILNNYIKKIKEINEEYKEYLPSESWSNTLKHYLEIIDDYDRINPNLPLVNKLDNDKYREAYEWIQKNTTRMLDDNVRKNIKKAFKLMRGEENNSTVKKTLSFLKSKEFTDKWGRLDGRKLSIEQQKAVVEYIYGQQQFDDNLLSDNALITRSKESKPIYKNSFYTLLYGNSLYQENPDRLKIINDINKIILNANAVNKNGLDVVKLFETLTVDELIKFKNLVNTLVNFKDSNSKFTPDQVIKINANSRKVADIGLWKEDYTDIVNKFKNIDGKKIEIFEDIFGDSPENANYLFYGWRAPLAADEKSYIDIDKEWAREFINKNIEFVTNEYYKLAKEEAIKNGTYDEWFKANHYYNQFTHRYEASPIWTEMNYIGDAKDNVYSYLPTGDNVMRSPKEKYRNKNYSQYGSRYNSNNGEYNNTKIDSLNADEKEMLELLKRVANKYAINNAQRAFSSTYAPRLMAHKADKKWWKEILLDTVGLNYHNANDQTFYERLGYLYDQDPDFQMFEFLKNKESKKKIKPRAKLEGETDEEYRLYLSKVKKENDEIEKKNIEIDNSLRNNDWRSVFADLITEGENYLARNKSKNTLYLLMEDLMDNDAIKVNVRDKISVDKKETINDNNIYYQLEKQKNALEVFRTFTRRVIYDQYKKPSRLNEVARVLQGFTSAKYMMLNVHGGIANVSTGLVNILAERFAGDYFTHKSWYLAKSRYSKNILSTLADLYDTESSTFTSGLIKLLNAVDYDEITGRISKSENAVEFAQKINDLLYSPNAMGEHYMQNTAALAMIEDSRIYEDSNGDYKIGTLKDYIRDIEIETLYEVVKEYKDKYNINGNSIETVFNNYIKRIKEDKNYQYGFDTFKKDVCSEFLKLISKSDENNVIVKEYIKRRKIKTDEAKKQFEKEAKFIDQFEFVKNNNGRKGYTRIKKDSLLNYNPNTKKLDVNYGNTKFAIFSRKVKYVNKKIHGVYDKLGRATVENEFWGSLAMQYHKHIYPGIMKRYRGLGREIGLNFGSQGYYNELTESTEMGSYTSLIKFLGTEFKKPKQSIDELGNIVDDEVTALESLQNVSHAIVATITNIATNWNLLSNWEQRNIIRALGDFAGILGTALMVLGIYALWDDDEIKDSIVAANALYTANRMFSEAYMYLPTGLFSEADSLWASPIAGGSNLKDIYKAASILSDTLFDEEFEPKYHTGRYKGRYKLEVLATRNTPVYRIYQNIMDMGSRHTYYKGATGNSSAQLTLRAIGKSFHD